MLFLLEWVQLLGCLVALGLAGGFVLAPFAGRLPYLWLAAPLAGIGMLSLGLTLAYSLDLPLVWDLALTFVGCSSLTLFRLRRQLKLSNLLLPAIVVLVVSALCTATMQETTLRAQGPGVLLFDGSDAMGYAHVSDWLRTHTWSQAPVADPTVPYQSWPAYGRSDHRPGAYLLLAALSWLRGESGLFTYDFASALAVCAALVGFAGAFARSRTGLVLLLAGAAVSAVFDLSRSGYFGKILAYPGAMLVASLFLESIEELDANKLSCLVALVLGVSLLQSGVAVALFLCIAWIGVPLVVVRDWASRSEGVSRASPPLRTLGASFGSLVVLAGLAAASWLLVRGGLPNQPMTLAWDRILAIGLDLNHHGASLKGFTRSTLNLLVCLAVSVQLLLAAVALRHRNEVALGLLGGPLMFLVAALCLNLRWPFYQSTGALYLLTLAGAVRLWEELPRPLPRVCRVGVAILLTLVIVTRLPRFVFALNRYLDSGPPPSQRFIKADLDEIHTIIGDKTVDLQLAELYSALVVLVELGRRDVKMQMDPQTWRALLAYRRWPPPVVDRPGDLLLTRAKIPPPAGSQILFRNSQYILVQRTRD